MIWFPRDTDTDRSARRYALTYFIFGIIAILLLVVVVPPYQVPDEVSHLRRIDQISRGVLVGVKVGETSGGTVSTGIAESAAPYVGIQSHADAKVTREMYARAALPAWSSAPSEPAWFSNTAPYPPFLYLPAVAGVLFGKVADLGVLTTLTLSRAANGVVALTLCAAAIALAGAAAPFLFVVLSLPMTLFQMASVSQDGPLFAVVALAVAFFVAARERERSSTAGFALMCAGIAMVTMTRPPYTVLALLPLLAAGHAWATRLIGAAAVVAATGFWVWLVAPIAGNVAHPDVHPAAQVAMIWNEPVKVMWMIGRSHTASLLDSFIGRLGWLDTRLPLAFHIYAVTMLIVAGATAAAALRRGASAWATSLIMAAILGCDLLIFVIMFVTWTAPGFTMIAGVQGRYLIPLALFLAAALPAWRGAPPRIIARGATALVLAFLPVSIVVMMLALWQRFYGW